MTIVKSSNVSSVGWEDNALEVVYNGGGRYRYADVPRELFDALLAAESKGRFLRLVIAPKYEATKVPPRELSEMEKAELREGY